MSKKMLLSLVLLLVLVVVTVVYLVGTKPVNDYVLVDGDNDKVTNTGEENVVNQVNATSTNVKDDTVEPTVSATPTKPTSTIDIKPTQTLKEKLVEKKWSWVTATLEDGRVVSPRKLEVFTLTFKDDATFGASTDCNGVGGDYRLNNSSLVLDKMMMTEMYCENSQESDFVQILQNVTSFSFSEAGELVLNLKSGGIAIFK